MEVTRRALVDIRKFHLGPAQGNLAIVVYDQGRLVVCMLDGTEIECEIE